MLGIKQPNKYIFNLILILSFLRSAIILPESEEVKKGRRAWYSQSAQTVEMVEDGATDQSREQGRQEGGGREHGSQTDSQNNIQIDQNPGQSGVQSNFEGPINIDSKESSGVEKEAQYQKEMRRQKLRGKKRTRGGDDSDEDDYVEARVPRDLLRKLSLLSVSLGLSVRQQLAMTMATYDLIGEWY